MPRKAEIYFVHGWGFDSRIWDSWLPASNPDLPIFNFDRGYFNGKQQAFALNKSSLAKIVIVHSFGLHFIPPDLSSQIDLLVIISGFRYFHEAAANEKLSKKRIEQMKHRLLAQPQHLLDDFYRNCGLKSTMPPTNINRQALYDDLSFLNEHRIDLADLSRVPQILLLHGAGDQIVDSGHSQQLNELLPNSILCINNNAPHALPATDVHWCINAIMDNQKYIKQDIFVGSKYDSYPKISGNFSRRANSYEQLARVQKYAAERLAQRIVKQAKIPVEGSILEIGCGTGLLSEHLNRIFPDQSIFFLDPATNMLERCQDKLSKNSTNRMFIESTIENYLIDHRYSQTRHALIASSFAFHWLLDLKPVLWQLLERLSARGQLFFSLPLSGSFPEWQAVCHRLKIAFTANQLPGLDEIKLAAFSAGAQIDCEEYSCQLNFNNALQFFQEMKTIGASTIKSSALISAHNTSSTTSPACRFRSLIKTWDNQTQATLGNGDSGIISTYKILEGTITRR